MPPNASQRTVAVGEEPARVIAVGAPKSSDGAVVEEPCPECDEETDRDFDVADGGETYVLYCAECGTEVERLRAGPE